MAALYLDNDVSLHLAGALRHLGHHVITEIELDLRAARDYVHLLTAAERQHILVTHNRWHFRELDGAWRLWSAAWHVEAEHVGILVLPQTPTRPMSEIADDIDHFLDKGPELRNRIYRRTQAGWESGSFVLSN